MNQPDTSTSTFALPLPPPLAMLTIPLAVSWPMTMFALVVPIPKFTSDVVGAVLPAYSVR